MKKFTVWAMVALVSFSGLVGCARKIDGETPAQFKQRKVAIYTAQGFEALRGVHRMVAVFEDNGVVAADSAKNAYVANDRIATGLDVVADRLQAGLPANDTIAKIQALLDDLDKAEAASLLALKDPNSRAKYAEVIFSIRFTLNSIKAVLAATKEPAFAQAESVAASARSVRGSKPAWWTDAILVVQETLTTWITQSRLSSAAEAWANARATSEVVHSLNKGRLGL